MVSFPNCKINLGLHVVNKRPDGFHNIETVFYPLAWRDLLEVIEDTKGQQDFSMEGSGLPVAGNTEQNLVYKAWQLMKARKPLPALKVYLHKVIPMGAGLGGGSSDAAFFINLVNTQFELGFTESERTEMASALGSDCAFFIRNSPVLAKGRGDEFSPVNVNLSAYYILAVFPGIHSDTRMAYQGLTPKQPGQSLQHILETMPPTEWKNVLVNDFEPSIFEKFPAIAALKSDFYKAGALYASMSGSGSAVYGIFNKEPDVSWIAANYKYFLQTPV